MGRGGHGDGQADRQTSSPPCTPHFLGIQAKNTQALEQKYSWKHFITLYQGVISVSWSPFYGCSTDWSWHAQSHPSDSSSFWLCHYVSWLQVSALPVESSQTAGCKRGKGCRSNTWTPKHQLVSLQTGRKGKNFKGTIKTKKCNSPSKRQHRFTALGIVEKAV